MKPEVIKGRIWVVKDENGNFIDNIDTDMIFHNKYLAITDISKMGQYAFSNLPGWTDFPKKAQPGDILIVGENFGAGSSRQQAVDCFIALGVSLIIGGSFGAIYKRNAINSGLPIIEFPDVKKVNIKNGDIIEVNLLTGDIKNDKGELIGKAKPFSKVQWEIYQAGNLFEYAKKIA